MYFSKLADCFQELESTSSRLEMTAILADLIKKVSDSEIDKICYLLLGRLVPLYQSLEFNLADKMLIRILARSYEVQEKETRALFGKMGDLGKVAESLSSEKVKKGPTVEEVFGKLKEIALEAGEGSQERKINSMTGLLKQLDGKSAKYAVRIVLGKLRLGLADKTIIEALSWMKRGDKSLKQEIEKVYFVYPNIGKIAKRFKKGGIKSIYKIDIEVGVPILSALCQRMNTAREIIEKVGKVAVEPKFDGTRIQIHFSKKKKEEKSKVFIRTFTRNLDDTTHMFPDLLEAVFRCLNASEVILDGEAVGFNPKTGELLPFQMTIQRKRKYGVKEKLKEVPLKLILFDLLYLNGKSLLFTPFAERRKLLERIVKKDKLIELTPQFVTSDAQELERYLYKVMGQGLEGLVVKQVNAFYEAGARGFSWIKFKREEKEGGKKLEDTIDCVVLGYNQGAGKRSQFGIGAFLVGVYDKKKDIFKTVAKIGTGLKDDEWRKMKERCDRIKVAKKPARIEAKKELVPHVWVNPEMVVAIRADEITKSPAHTAGYALRFPRLIAFRDDKSPEESTSLKEIDRLYKMQFKRKKK